MAGEWIALLALIGVVAVVVAVLIGVFAGRRRRAAAADDRGARLDAARRATREMARDARRRGRGTLRGKGMGGDQSIASDAASEVNGV
jgi:type II secretory pathway pseudopilin PulG